MSFATQEGSEVGKETEEEVGEQAEEVKSKRERTLSKQARRPKRPGRKYRTIVWKKNKTLVIQSQEKKKETPTTSPGATCLLVPKSAMPGNQDTSTSKINGSSSNNSSQADQYANLADSETLDTFSAGLYICRSFQRQEKHIRQAGGLAWRTRDGEEEGWKFGNRCFWCHARWRVRQSLRYIWYFIEGVRHSPPRWCWMFLWYSVLLSS